MKKVASIHSAPAQHWVGDGFPVRSLFSYDRHARELSPFLLLDYAAPRAFPAAERPRGVGQHPHRGFETVTIVYQGEVEHRDSTGGGIIGPQLELPDAAGTLRVIAGEYDGRKGPARTFSPLGVWDLRLASQKRLRFEVPAGWTTAIAVLHGTVLINDEVVREAQFALLDRAGSGGVLEANNDARMLVLSGEPIDEPVVGHGPFVMNSEREIIEAIQDFNSGRFGRMAH